MTTTFDMPVAFQLTRHRAVPLDEYEELRDARRRASKLTEQRKWSIINRLVLVLLTFLASQAIGASSYFLPLLFAILIVVAIVIVGHLAEFRS